VIGRDAARGRSDAEPKPLRLFVAMDVPEPLKMALAAAVAPFRDRIPGARWTNLDGWHVTLKFLGATWPRVVANVDAAVASVAAGSAPFETAITELGVFPSPRRARVVWAGLSDAGGRFANLVRSLDERLADDFEPEDRPFTPHLTVARLTPTRDINEFAPGLVGTSVASEPFLTTHLVLYRSHLSPKGATYEPVLRAPLGDPGIAD
jgi:2'-5' RNA ligase